LYFGGADQAPIGDSVLVEFEFANVSVEIYRLEKRRQAMMEMPKMIQNWKEVSYPYIHITPVDCELTTIFYNSGAMAVAGKNGQNRHLVWHCFNDYIVGTVSY
jgi:hypothetical protein